MEFRETRHPIFTGCTILKTMTLAQTNGTRTNHFGVQTENVQMLSRYVASAHHALLPLAPPPASAIRHFTTQADGKLNATGPFFFNVTKPKVARQQSLLIGRAPLVIGLCHRHFEDANNISSVCTCFRSLKQQDLEMKSKLVTYSKPAGNDHQLTRSSTKGNISPEPPIRIFPGPSDPDLW